MLGQLRKFLTELGWDFYFAGSEFPLQVGERDFAVDLLFFHRGPDCPVAIELKVGRLRAGAPGQAVVLPGDAGPGRARAAQEPDHQRAAVREQGRRSGGVCAQPQPVTALIAEYQMQRPDKRLLQQQKLHEFYQLNLSEAGGEAGVSFPRSAHDKDSGVDLDPHERY